MRQHDYWRLKDTVYLEPTWEKLEFLKGGYGDKDGHRYEELRKSHEATLLGNSYGGGLIAVLLRSNDYKREVKEDGRQWHATFEDAVEAVVAEIQRRIREDRNQVEGTLLAVAHYREQREGKAP